MALITRYFRELASGAIIATTVEDEAPISIPDGFEYLPDGAALFVEQQAAVAAQITAAQEAQAAVQQAAHAARQAVLQLVVDAVNEVNPSADLTVAQLIDAFAGTPAAWQTIPDLFP